MVKVLVKWVSYQQAQEILKREPDGSILCGAWCGFVEGGA